LPRCNFLFIIIHISGLFITNSLLRSMASVLSVICGFILSFSTQRCQVIILHYLNYSVGLSSRVYRGVIINFTEYRSITDIQVLNVNISKPKIFCICISVKHLYFVKTAFSKNFSRWTKLKKYGKNHYRNQMEETMLNFLRPIPKDPEWRQSCLAHTINEKGINAQITEYLGQQERIFTLNVNEIGIMTFRYQCGRDHFRILFGPDNISIIIGNDETFSVSYPSFQSRTLKGFTGTDYQKHEALQIHQILELAVTKKDLIFKPAVDPTKYL
jgi:hypothetical protein